MDEYKIRCKICDECFLVIGESAKDFSIEEHLDKHIKELFEIENMSNKNENK